MSESSNSSLEPEAKFIRVDFDNEKISPANTAEIESAKLIAQERSERVREIESDTEGLNTERVLSFLDRYGLTPTDFAVVDSDRKSQVEEVLNSLGHGADTERMGTFLPEERFAVIYRDKDEEDQLGPGFIESLLVHELVHSSSQYKDMQILINEGKADISRSRSGQVTLDGAFFEEAFAEYLRNKYITDVLELKNGFYDSTGSMLHQIKLQDGALRVRLPFRYKVPGNNIGGNTTVPSIAATGLEMLLQKDPTILDAMLRGRRDVEGLRELAKKVNAIQPGLYTRLRRLDYDVVHFMFGTRQIIDALYDGDEEAAIAQLD